MFLVIYLSSALIFFYRNHLPGQSVNVLPPGLVEGGIALLMATDWAEVAEGVGVCGTGQHHAWGGDMGVALGQT